MKRIILIGLSAFVISGCSATTKIKHELVLIEPPASLLNCPGLPPTPNSDTLTNQEITEYIEELRRRLIACNVNMNKIDQFIKRTKNTLEQKK